MQMILSQVITVSDGTSLNVRRIGDFSKHRVSSIIIEMEYQVHFGDCHVLDQCYTVLASKALILRMLDIPSSVKSWLAGPAAIPQQATCDMTSLIGCARQTKFDCNDSLAPMILSAHQNPTVFYARIWSGRRCYNSVNGLYRSVLTLAIFISGAAIAIAYSTDSKGDPGGTVHWDESSCTGRPPGNTDRPCSIHFSLAR
jgi:hypothetical protein